MIEKAIDAAAMFWSALDERERRLLLLAGLWVGVLVLSTLEEERRRRREEDLFDRLRLELNTK